MDSIDERGNKENRRGRSTFGQSEYRRRTLLRENPTPPGPPNPQKNHPPNPTPTANASAYIDILNRTIPREISEGEFSPVRRRGEENEGYELYLSTRLDIPFRRSKYYGPMHERTRQHRYQGKKGNTRKSRRSSVRDFRKQSRCI